LSMLGLRLQQEEGAFSVSSQHTCL
jgi:hypothetical protein